MPSKENGTQLERAKSRLKNARGQYVTSLDQKTAKGGRPTGSRNKTPQSVRDVYMQVFEEMGGVEIMRRWAKANKDDFFKQFSKMLPKEVKIEGTVSTPRTLAELSAIQSSQESKE